MMSATLFRLLRLSRRIWVRTVLISLLAAVAAIVAPFLEPLLPDWLTRPITDRALYRLISILTSTMLTVTTFSLTVIAASHLTASQTVTPRVHRLLREDSSTQIVLATFMGAFVYSLGTLLVLDLKLPASRAPGTVYVFTAAVLGLVVLAILRWIQELSTLGAMDSTTRRVETLARTAIRTRLAEPALGGHPIAADAGPPDGAKALEAPTRGFVQSVDVPRLGRHVADTGGRIQLAAMPGDWVNPGTPLAWMTGELAKTDCAALSRAFVIDDVRTFEADPAYGLIVLSEIASRALSPGINDPRTAEDVLLRLAGLLAEAAGPGPDADDIARDWLDVPKIDPELLVRQALDPIARDGAGFIEVQLRMMKVLSHLSRLENPAFAEAARNQAKRVLAYAEPALPLPEDFARLETLAPH